MPRVPRLSIEQRVAIVRLYFSNGKNAYLTAENELWKKENCSGAKERWHHCSENAADPNSEHKKTPSRDRIEMIKCTEDAQEDFEDEGL
ncbi:hypothetical protein EMCRGX_G005813 [Ephydatia muelleri]